MDRLSVGNMIYRIEHGGILKMQTNEEGDRYELIIEVSEKGYGLRYIVYTGVDDDMEVTETTSNSPYDLLAWAQREGLLDKWYVPFIDLEGDPDNVDEEVFEFYD